MVELQSGCSQVNKIFETFNWFPLFSCHFHKIRTISFPTKMPFRTEVYNTKVENFSIICHLNPRWILCLGIEANIQTNNNRKNKPLTRFTCSSFVFLVNQFPVKQKFLKVQQFRWHKRNSRLSFFCKSADGKRLRNIASAAEVTFCGVNTAASNDKHRWWINFVIQNLFFHSTDFRLMSIYVPLE